MSESLPLKYYCEFYNNGLRDIPDMKILISRLLAVVNELQNRKNPYNVSHCSDNFIINEIGKRYIKAYTIHHPRVQFR